MTLSLDGVSIPDPTDMRVSKYESSREGRMSDGTLKKDQVAIKLIFTLMYRGIDPDDLAIFEDIVDDPRFVEFIYTKSGVQETRTVWVSVPGYGSFSQNPEIWKDVTITLTEQ